MVVASRNFRDEEYFDVRRVLESYGLEVVTASSKEGHVRSAFGKFIMVDRLVSCARAKDFDAIVFVGGDGVLEFLEVRSVKRLIRDAVSLGRVVSAICMAPILLANAGVLEGRRVTGYADVKDALISAGAIWTSEGVACDGNIVTADGPASAVAFGETIAKLLLGPQKGRSHSGG
jgi:protease I